MCVRCSYNQLPTIATNRLLDVVKEIPEIINTRNNGITFKAFVYFDRIAGTFLLRFRANYSPAAGDAGSRAAHAEQIPALLKRPGKSESLHLWVGILPLQPRVSARARKLAGRPYASTLAVRRPRGGDGTREGSGGGDGVRGRRRGRAGSRNRERTSERRTTGAGGRGRVFPHYKFNLTNGSENLETMEYMKCGRVYHAARRRRAGIVPTAILSGPIHILRQARRYDLATGGGEGEAERECRKWSGTGKTRRWHDKKSRAETHGSCRAVRG